MHFTYDVFDLYLFLSSLFVFLRRLRRSSEFLTAGALLQNAYVFVNLECNSLFLDSTAECECDLLSTLRLLATGESPYRTFSLTKSY